MGVLSTLAGCGKALLEFPQPHPWPGRRRKLYLRDTLRLPARGFAPLHTPNFSSLIDWSCSSLLRPKQIDLIESSCG